MTDDPRVDELLDELLESGGSPEEVCRGCPELLPEVRAGLRRLRLVEEEVGALFPPSTFPDGAGLPAPPTAGLPRVPGYEVQEVLGHGGMGVVYLARHLRLNRPVALKMLLAGVYPRPGELERFFREAEAVAGLRHANIVQVYDVGESEGRPYYTMEFVEGGTLARKMAGRPLPARAAAALLATLAEAIQAAHQSGVVHRDLTPANVLLTADGTPKITDFGLARRLHEAGDLTRSGVPIGTPSYMSPEQALGRRDAIGPATDVYALGAILYEMLTGRPPFRAATAQETELQVIMEEPVPPSRLHAKVPRDLETICLKCLHKKPRQRYAGGAALAEDLRRFLRGEAIAARPAGRFERLARWVRRRPARATLVLAIILPLLALAGDTAWRIRQSWLDKAAAAERSRNEAAAEADLRDVARLQRQSDYWEAGVALERGRARLGDSGPARLYLLVTQAQRDLELPLRLDAIHRERFTLVEGRFRDAAEARFNRARADRDYEEAFRSAGLGGPAEDPDATAARFRTSASLPALVAALDDWSCCSADRVRQAWLLRVARAADPDAWRDRARDPAAWGDAAVLAELARTAPIAGQPVSLLLALGERFQAVGGDGIGFVRKVQQAHPDDFWANFTLAAMIDGAGVESKDKIQAIPYYQKALTARPEAVAVMSNLGLVYFKQYWLDDNAKDWGAGAISRYRQALQIDPNFAPAHNNLGLVLKAGKGDWSGAVPHFREALRINPRLAHAHAHLGEIDAGQGRLDAAIDHYQQALRTDPDFAWAHYFFGVALTAKGRLDDANARYPEGNPRLAELRDLALKDARDHYKQARYFDPRWAPAPNALQLSPRDKARLREAIGHYREAIRLDPRLAEAHGALGQALLATREFAEAAAATRRSLDLLPPWSKGYRENLERQRQRCERLSGLQARLAAVVRGHYKPAAGDCLDLAELCYPTKHYATAARLYAEAFAAAPQLSDDLRTGHRLNAACAAACAGCGRGDDAGGLGEPEFQALRKRAREYMRLDLTAWAKKLDGGTAADRFQAQTTLPLWRSSPDLANLRDPAALDKRPLPEREECRALWRDFDALMERVQASGE